MDRRVRFIMPTPDKARLIVLIASSNSAVPGHFSPGQ